MPKRTLVVHTGALGDFLLACPAIEVLAREGEVEVAGHPERHAIAVAAGLAVRTHALDALCLHEVLAASGQGCTPASPPPRFVSFVQHFDRAVIWMRDPGGVLERAFRAAGVGDVLCRPGLPNADWPGHVSAYYLNTIGAPPVDSYRLNVPTVNGLDVVIAPGSGSPKKNWPLERYLALDRLLQKRGRQTTWLLGPAESEITLPTAFSVLCAPELTGLAGLLSATQLFIGNDSGITHLASIFGCPTLALFGPTNPSHWCPIGPNTRVLQGVPWPAVDEVVRHTRALDLEVPEKENRRFITRK